MKRNVVNHDFFTIMRMTMQESENLSASVALVTA